MKKYCWKVKKKLNQGADLAKKFKLHPVIAGIIANRGVRKEQLKFFLESSLTGLHSPSLLPDIKKAKKRIRQAVSSREKVMVFGDYDVDGVVSLAVFNEFAKKFPGTFSFYIPHRVKEGYGLSKEAVAKAKKNKISLIISFDCGINSCQEIDYANSLGVDVVVVDHHLPQDKLPEAIALVNPKRKDSKYPYSDLTAGGLSFKLLQALEENDCHSVIDLVALSIVCDVAPLLGENRILLKEGVKLLRESRRPAIKALCRAAKIKQENITNFHIGYILGPRVNASGRIAHAQDSLNLFLVDDQEKADQLALKLNQHNRLRKNVEKQILKEAEQKIKTDLCGEHALVIGDSGWHPGVLGIVASRLKDKYYRPSIVVSFDNGVAKGSGRSTEDIHLIEMLHKCSDSLTVYGGHKKAVGMELEEEKLDLFRQNINLAIQENMDSAASLPTIEIDAKLKLKQIDNDFVSQLESLSPFGEGNPKPLFLAEKLSKKKNIEKIKSWFSVWLTDQERVFEAITYSKDLAEIINYGEKIDVVFSLDKNGFHNHPRLVLRDCRLS